MLSKPKIIIVLGPTAAGKSELAVNLALRLGSGQAKKSYGINGAEIISADSRQVYKGLDIGSGKITQKEMQGIPHYLLSVASPKKTFTVSHYQKLARKMLQKILKRGKLPIICGGTGFYIDALLYNYELPKVPPQPKLRKQLEKKSAEELFQQLKKLDPRRAKNIDSHNKCRLIRALEIFITTKKPVPLLKFAWARSHFARPKAERALFACLKIGVKKSPLELKKLIAKRLQKRLKQGMINEVKKLHGQGLSWKKLESFGLEYRCLAKYLQNKINRQEMMNCIQKESEHYAKRQMTWFKRDKRIIWIKNYQDAEKKVKAFI